MYSFRPPPPPPPRVVRRIVLVVSIFVSTTALLSLARAADELGRPRSQSERFQGPLQEPPERVADALDLALEVSFDWEDGRVDGKVTHRFRALEDSLAKISLHAVGIDVKSVVAAGGRALEHESFEDRLVIRLPEPVARGEEFGFSIEYSCQPTQGLYFRRRDPDAPHIPQQIWTQGESHEARHWIPCFDHPADKLTSEIQATVPVGLEAISNGKLAEVRDAESGGGKVYHWRQEKPHTTYLIALVVGEFARYDDTWNDVPLRSFVPASRAADAERSFALTADMMEYFSQLLDYPYPWDKYDQIVVHEFHFGGMENTGTTILTERTLHDAVAASDVDSDGLVAHELAHQWFGDLITCRDWAHLWLNESCATFLENQYHGYRRGWDEEVYDRKGQGDSYFGEDSNSYRRPLVTRHYKEPEYMFDSHTYPKGARILAMLMHVVGKKEFYAGLGHFLKKHAFESVESEDLRLALEEATGRSLRWFFEQWVYSGGHPEYRVSYEWDEDKGSLQLVVEQVQHLDEVTRLFRMPVEIEITTAAGKTLERIEVAGREETFTFKCAERPRMVRFDKDGWILKQLDFPKSREEFLYQLEEDTNILGRIQAAEGLAQRKGDDHARDALLRRLKEDPFWGVRREIAAQLKTLKGEKVRGGLAEALAAEKSSKVRRAIVDALEEFPGPETVALLRETIASDPSYYVVAEALRALAAIEEGAAGGELLRALGRDSHLDVVRIAAMRALGSLAEKDKLSEAEHAALIDRLLEYSLRRFPVWTRGAAMGTLASIGSGNEKVFETISSALDDDLLNARMAAVRALGGLGDERAIELLERRRGLEAHRPFRDPIDTIDQAIRNIRSARSGSPVDDRLDQVEKSQQELERRIEELEKRGAEI